MGSQGNGDALGCPIIVGDGPAGMVWLAYDKYSRFATEAYNLASNQAYSLNNFTLTPITVGTHFNLNPAVTGFVRPHQPTIPDVTYNDPGRVPDPPEVQVSPVAFGTAPSEPNVPPPVFDSFAAPGPLTATPPQALPELPPISIPDLPNIQLPPVPTLRDLNLPAAPDIQIPAFQGTHPVNSLQAPTGNWSFTPEQYTSALLDKVSGTVGRMLDGGTGLPTPLAQALRDRAMGVVDVEELRGEQTVLEDFASRGFVEPNGLMMKRLAQSRQDAANRRSGINRDIYVQDQQVAIENLRFAVTQGIALESTLIQAHNEEMRLSLQAAQFARETALAVFNAKVSLFNTEMQAYQIDAQVWRSQIEGALAALQVYRAKIEAQQLIGQINEQDVRIYSARLQGVTVQADLYRTQMQGAEAQARANASVAEAYRARLQGYSEQVRAFEVQWDAYSKQMATNETRARIYELTEDAYATRVRAYSEVNNTKISQQRASIDTADMRLRAWHGQVEAFTARSEGERSRIAALVAASSQKVDLYRAEVGVETAASDANLRALQVALSAEGSRVDAELKNADLRIRQMEQNAALLLEAKKTLAQVAAQLAASSMSAVNFSAGTHSGLSQSFGCSTGFNYSGQIDPST